jgi:tetratricopeptide (TPR) repeat protein
LRPSGAWDDDPVPSLYIVRVRTAFSILIAGSVALMTPSAWAQDEKDALEELVVKGTKRPVRPEADKGRFTPPEINEKRLEVQWGFYRSATGLEAAQIQFDKALDMAAMLGIGNQPEAAVSLLADASTAAKAGDVARAKTLVDRAHMIAPDLAAVQFARAGLAGRFSLGALIDAWSAGWSFLPTRMAFVGLGTVVLAVFFLGFAFLVGIITLIRHLRLLAGDLCRMLPRGVTVMHTTLFILIGLIGLVLLSGSPVLGVAVVLTIFAAYMSWSERFAACVALAGLAVAPDAVSVAHASFDFVDSTAYRYAAWAHTGCMSDCTDALSKEGAAADKSEDGRFAHARRFLVATANLRRGDQTAWSASKMDFEALAKDPSVDPALRGAIHNNLGVARAVTGDMDGAQVALREAARVIPEAFGPHINMSRVFEEGGETTSARAAFQRALALGSNFAANRGVEQRRTVALYFEIMSLPTDPLFGAHLARYDGVPPPAPPLWERFAGTLSLAEMRYVAAVAAGGFWILILLGLLLRASRRCPTCGQHMIPKSTGEHGEVEGVCRACYDCYGGGGNVDYQSRVARDARVARNAVTGKWVFRVGNALGFGMGSSLSGGVMGIWVGATAILGAAILTVGPWAPPDPWRLVSLYDDGLETVGFVLLGASVVASLLLLIAGALPNRRPVRVSKRRPPRATGG